MALQKILIPLLSLCCIASFGCRRKSKKKPHTVTYFVHGDPHILVETPEKSGSIFTEANTGLFKGFHFVTAASFIEREPLAASSTWEQVEAANSTDAPDDQVAGEFDLLPFEFVKIDATHYAYRPENGSKGYQLNFELRDGLLVMTSYGTTSVTPQHYSLKADGKAFSILVSYEAANVGKVVTAFYFASSETVNPIELASKDFAFLFDTVKVAWKEPIEVQACGTFDPATQASLDASVNAWLGDTAPTAVTRPVKYTTRTSYAPFSDLNQHCIFLINNFKLENSVDFYTAGVTLPIINLAAKSIVDADVMLFMDHRNVAASFIAGTKSLTLQHEMGHFYGLGHEFKKDASGAALHPSIMGYSGKSGEITTWDFEAIRDLYSESLSAAPL